MATKTILFIEGIRNSPNGDLMQGFSKLLAQKLKGKLPRIILGDGKNQAIDKFKNNRLECDKSLLLIDLDRESSFIDADLQEHELTHQRENVFYMVQEMEAWFLSQPSILDTFYGKDDNGKLISEKLVKRKASEIPNPDQLLEELTKNSKKRKYHKVKHAVELLKLLDASKLENEFPDFKRLIEYLV
jgi:Domain of unknown function (DUF4276)